MYKVYYEDKTILFSDSGAGCPELAPVIDAAPRNTVRLANVLQKLENNKLLFIKAQDAGAAFDFFRSQFRLAEAAGGIVEDARGRILLIFRNGRWDLPKGHTEPGESCGECAAREVEEECGIRVSEVGESLPDTYHFYRLAGEWVMKRTAWFRMRGEGEPTPQVEEGITRAQWVEPELAADYIRGAFASVREVFRSAACPGLF